MKVHLKHGKVTQNMHGASINYRYVWDVSAAPRRRLENRLLFWGFFATGKNRGQGRAPEVGGPPPPQAASRRGHGGGRASRAPGALLAPSGPSYGPVFLRVRGFYM